MPEIKIPFANLTEKELKKLQEAESFLNDQPDHKKDLLEGKEVVLLAFINEKRN